MKISVTVKTGYKNEPVHKTSNGAYSVAVKEKAIEGKANRAVIKAVASYFGVAPSLVQIVSGATAKNKIIEILGYGQPKE